MHTNAKAAVVSADEADVLWFLGGDLLLVRMPGERTGDQLMLIEATGPRGSAQPWHRHRYDDETFHILDGEITIWCDDQPGPARSPRRHRLPPPPGPAHLPRQLWDCTPARNRHSGDVRSVLPRGWRAGSVQERTADPTRHGQDHGQPGGFGIEILGRLSLSTATGSCEG
jgi:hypothetical protein